MNFDWNLTPLKESSKSLVGVLITINGKGIVLQDTFSPTEMRELGVGLIDMADEVDPPKDEENGS